MEETFLFNEDRGAPRPRAEKSLPGQARKTVAVAETGGESDSAAAASGEHRNIPAILPYEVKEALLRDMREDNTKPPKEKAEQSRVRVGLNNRRKINSS